MKAGVAEAGDHEGGGFGVLVANEPQERHDDRVGVERLTEDLGGVVPAVKDVQAQLLSEREGPVRALARDEGVHACGSGDLELRARAAGDEATARVFEETADQEVMHAFGHLDLLYPAAAMTPARCAELRRFERPEIKYKPT